MRLRMQRQVLRWNKTVLQNRNLIERRTNKLGDTTTEIEGWAQDYGNSNIFLKPLFRGNLDPFVNNANLGAIAHTSNGT